MAAGAAGALVSLLREHEAALGEMHYSSGAALELRLQRQ